MGNDQGALQVKAEPPAPDVTPDQRSPSAEEAQTESPKLDSTLNSQHGTPKIGRPDEEVSASEADFTAHRNSGASVEGGVNGRYTISAPSSES